MSYAKATKITAWSYSRYHDYVTCPLKAKLKHVDKIQEPPNEAMARGSWIGKLAEDYLNNKLKVLPKELKLFRADFQEGRRNVAKKTVTTVVEDTWAFTKTWARTKWNDWEGCWLRVKLDYAFILDGDTLYITDWKTGKFREQQVHEYLEQLEIYALAGMLIYPGVKKVYPCLKYLDLGRTYPDEKLGDTAIVYTRGDIPKLIKTWEGRVKPMLADTAFAPRPNFGCQWCFYRAGNKTRDPANPEKQPGGGGQCKF